MINKEFSISKLPILLLVSVLALAACGGESSDTSDTTVVDQTTPTQAEVDVNEAVTQYTECMRDAGIDIGDPTTDENGNLVPGTLGGVPQPGADGGGSGGGPGGGLDEKTQAALQECNQLLEGTGLGFGGPPGGGDFGDIEAQLEELTACLADQGIEPPDDQSNSQGQPGGPFGALGGLDSEDPEVAAAVEACSEFFPDFGAGGGPGGGQFPPPGQGDDGS